VARPVDDPDGVPDELQILAGDDAGELLGAAVGTAGGRLVQWWPSEVDHRPGDGTTVSYGAVVAWPDGEREETLGASTAIAGRPLGTGPAPADAPGVLTLSDGRLDVSVWMLPADPGLPALTAACDDAPVRRLLASFGVVSGPLTFSVLSYRPRRRAVVEARGDGVRLFLKVLRPGKAGELHRRHRLLREGGVPVPRSLGYTDDGLLVLEALPGESLREELRRGSRAAPPAEHLLSLLDSLPAAVADLPRRTPWAASAGHYADQVGLALPAEAARATQLAAALGAGVAGAPDGDEPTHGDLYETQLLVAGGEVHGLLDVDTAGPGRRADDLGCLLAHLLVLADLEPQHAASTRALAERYLTAFDRHVDPAVLRCSAAGVTLSLATGPHRVQEPDWQRSTRTRLDLVERWLDAAARV
jgi:aminoglycoside phosphotransferase